MIDRNDIVNSNKKQSIKLSDRMKCIADIVTPGKRVADIGCDHALVSIYLAQSGLAEKVIAMDVAQGPLSCAVTNIQKYGLSEKIETRLSDGMTALKPGETDAAVIAGMGGLLIVDILKKGLSPELSVITDQYELYLSPQSEIPEVRKFLRENSFCIVDEHMMQEDGKYYNIIKAVFRASKYASENDSIIEAENATENQESDTDKKGSDNKIKIADTYGEKLIQKKNPVLKKYLEERIEKLNGIYCRLSKQTGENVIDRMSEINAEVDEISRVLEEIKG